MFDNTFQNPSKIRVGILTEIDFLPVCPTVKRAIQITRQALVDAGYDVVDHHIDASDYAEAKNYIIGMVSNGTVKHLIKDWNRQGERVQMDMKLNSILLQAGPILRTFLKCVLRAAGMGRLVSGLDNAYLMNDD